MRESRGILVYVQVREKEIAEVSWEMLEIGKSLADAKNGPLYVCLAGNCAENELNRLFWYGIRTLYTGKDDISQGFCEEEHGLMLTECIWKCCPEVVLTGSTPEGKSTAAFAAANLRTGLTADCTALSWNKDGLLLQTRPAYGGKIMADILTKTARPQMVTVRQGAVQEHCKKKYQKPKMVYLNRPVCRHIQILSEKKQVLKEELRSAETILAIGAGIREKSDIKNFYNYAEKIGAYLAASRALTEKGWMPAHRQIGLSGSAVFADLLICCGISGSVQFCAGIQNVKKIIAVNTDKKAPIFKMADVCITGDMYEVMEKLTDCFF